MEAYRRGENGSGAGGRKPSTVPAKLTEARGRLSIRFKTINIYIFFNLNYHHNLSIIIIIDCNCIPLLLIFSPTLQWTAKH